MSDERIIQAMALGPDGEDYLVARQTLAALREEGWSLYRPDECAEVECFPSGLTGQRVDFDGQYLQVWDTHAGTFGTMPESGTYRLVPVEEGEN